MKWLKYIKVFEIGKVLKYWKKLKEIGSNCKFWKYMIFVLKIKYIDSAYNIWNSIEITYIFLNGLRHIESSECI